MIILEGLFLGLVGLGLVKAQNASLELDWSYGRSPLVYPSPSGAGIGDWADAYAKAKALVAKLSNEEKANLAVGQTGSTGCSGTSGGAKSVSFPGLCLQDGPTGVRGTDLVTSYPAETHIGASWNRSLANDVATFMGAEFKRKGVNVALAPVVGPIGRVALGGRNWEGYADDPFLAGALGAEAISGFQKSVIASVKHFVGNEQETNRNPSINGSIQSVSSNIDDRTMHELYLWPFQDAVKAGAACVMCSYNRINNSYGCQNSKTMNGLLKTELGFQGFVVSDWGAQHAGFASAAAGLDMVMPDAAFWSNGTLVAAVQNGSLPQARLDDMTTRIVASWYKLGMDSPSYPPLGIGMPTVMTEPHPLVEGRDPASKSTLLQAAIEGHVLVKNVENTLPLKSPKLLSLFGFDAFAPLVNNPSNVSYNRWTLGFESVGVSATQLLGLLSGLTTQSPGTATNGTLTIGGGSGSSTGSYISAPYNAFEQRAYEDGTYLLWDFQNPNPNVNPASNACIVFINEFSTEAADRPGLADANADKLVINVASKCSSTIVVIHNAGIRLVDAWIDNVNVTAVVLAHLPGQDSGRALVQVMYGKQGFSGRLPYTVGKSEQDYGDLLSPSQPGPFGTSTNMYPQSDFKEGLYIGYRDFIARNITPRFAFGYGLTYTTFAYSLLAITPLTANLTYPLPAAAIAQGGNPHLFDVIAIINCSVTNTGPVAGAEVAQLYIGIPNSPPKQLRGFEKKLLAPGQAKTFGFVLARRDLSIWSTEEQNWVLQRGNYPVYVGASVLDIKLQGVLTI